MFTLISDKHKEVEKNFLILNCQELFSGYHLTDQISRCFLARSPFPFRKAVVAVDRIPHYFWSLLPAVQMRMTEMEFG